MVGPILRLVLLAWALAATLGGCAVVDPVDQRYDNITRSLAKARNESIFLNIIRASHDWPLSFATIANITPSMTNTSSLGLPSFLVGPNAARSLNPGFTPGRDFIFGNQSATNSLMVSSNFNISTQETSAFYEGFLRPVDLHILNYFIRQGYSRELLFWLFTESVEVGPPSRAVGFRYNPPSDYGCPKDDPKGRCFREIVEIAVITGLTVETRTVPGNGGKDNAGGGGKSAREIYARFCFSPVLARTGQTAMGEERVRELKQYMDKAERRPICGDHWDPSKNAQAAQLDTLEFRVGQSEFRIVTRSA